MSRGLRVEADGSGNHVLPGRKHSQPAWLGPTLATLVGEPFSREGWIFEPKFDGVRCLVFRNGKSIELLSRNRKRLNEAYPELIAPMLKQDPSSFVMDGEIVAFENGVTSFARLQRRMQVRDPLEARRRGVEVFYYAFDLPYLSGHDLRTVPLIRRKELLKENFRFHDPLRYTEHRERSGEEYYREACKNGLEGLIAKRADSAYLSERSRDWLKFKCSAEQEFVIIGYTDPKGTRAGFGALMLGYYEGDRLVCAGKVGTGFDTETLLDLRKKMARLEIEGPPAGVEPGRNVHWVKPSLVAQVAFTEWTRDGKLRHPRFQGIRTDKAAREIVREKPK
jgi:bifunctional non-homologous end joining protein LigD